MADNTEYRAIQGLYDPLVEAVSPHIDVLFNKAWSKDIIGKQQLDTSIDSSSSADRKATTLVSAIASRVKLRSSAFYEFLKLLKEFEGLQLIAQRLEARVRVLNMNINSQSASAGASSSYPDSRHQASSRTRFDEGLPKLDPVEDVTNQESGLGEDCTDSIAPDGVTVLEDLAAAVHFTPPVSSSQHYPQPFVSPGAGVLSLVETENFPTDSTFNSDQSVKVVTEAQPAEAVASQKLVVSSNQQLSTPASSGREPSLVEQALEQIRSENAGNVRQIEILSKQLELSQQSEAKLKAEVLHLQKQNELLGFQLRTREEETKQSKEALQRELDEVKSKLRDKEAEVIKLKEKLGAAEQQNVQAQRQEYREKIRTLEEERSQLKSEESILKERNEQNQREILRLQAQFNEKNAELNEKQAELTKTQTELNKIFKEKCALEVELANQKAELAVKRAELAEQIADSKDKDVALEQERSKAKMKQMEEDLKIHKENSVPKQLYEQTVKQMDEMRLQLERQSSNSLTSTPYANQTSLTESAQPSPSVSAPGENCIDDSLAQAINFSAKESDDDWKTETQDSNNDLAQ